MEAALMMASGLIDELRGNWFGIAPDASDTTRVEETECGAVATKDRTLGSRNSGNVDGVETEVEVELMME